MQSKNSRNFLDDVYGRKMAKYLNSRYCPPRRRQPQQSAGPEYVYAMVNRRNGLIKIGRSTNLRYREQTLQSEEPEVHLLFAFPAGRQMEREMHEYFAPNRVRGEWFRLDYGDLEALYVSLWMECKDGGVYGYY